MAIKERNSTYYIFLAIALIGIDQIIKHTVKDHMITKEIGIQLAYNTGAGFSILTGNNILLIIIGIIFTAIVSYYAYIEKNRLPYILIISGAIGNIIDRIFLGHVIDYIKIYWWPIFNMADSLIVIGAMILIYQHFSSKPKK